MDKGEEGAQYTTQEDDVTKKRLRIERGEFERELENLRKENDYLKKESEFLKKETEYLKKDKRRKSMDAEKGERMYASLDRLFGSPKGEDMDARRKLSWDLDRERGGEEPVKTTPLVESRRKSFGEREEMEKEGEGGMLDRPVERRRLDMEREIEMEKWKRQGQLEKDQERSKWKIEKDKEIERLKKYQELEKVSLPPRHSFFFFLKLLSLFDTC